MDPKRRVPAWVSISVAFASAGLLVAAGCALDKNGSQPTGVFERIGGHGGQTIEPKRCMLKVAIISRPFGDPVINDVVWRVADEQTVPPAERRAWESNGLRAGRITGEFPLELESILKDSTPGKIINTISFFVENGEQTLIRVSETVEQTSLLLNRDNRAFGKDFQDASGFFRVTVGHEGTHAVSVRIVPEIHHGPIHRSFQAMPNPSPLASQELRINDGQQEETLSDLPVRLVVEPGQAVVVGCFPEQRRVLGSFMFTQSVAHSDQRDQKLIVIWATRNLQGITEPNATASDRPKLIKRLVGPAAKQAPPRVAVRPSEPPVIPDVPRIADPEAPAPDAPAKSTNGPGTPTAQPDPKPTAPTSDSSSKTADKSSEAP